MLTAPFFLQKCTLILGTCPSGEPRCIAFGGLRVDDAIEEALFEVASAKAVEAAVKAEEEVAAQRDQAREALVRDLEAARYAVDRAFRQYNAADPSNRLVTAELEARWNAPSPDRPRSRQR